MAHRSIDFELWKPKVPVASIATTFDPGSASFAARRKGSVRANRPATPL